MQAAVQQGIIKADFGILTDTRVLVQVALTLLS